MILRRWPNLAVILLTLLAACHSSDEFIPTPNVPAGAMSYTGYDEDGRPVVRGWLRLDLGVVAAQPGVVTGEWELRALGSPGEIGPQIGRGVLEGSFVVDRFVANLNPNGLDDNVVLDGTLTIIGGPASTMRYEGTWAWMTLIGPRRTGTFKASE